MPLYPAATSSGGGGSGQDPTAPVQGFYLAVQDVDTATDTIIELGSAGLDAAGVSLSSGDLVFVAAGFWQVDVEWQLPDSVPLGKRQVGVSFPGSADPVLGSATWPEAGPGYVTTGNEHLNRAKIYAIPAGTTMRVTVRQESGLTVSGTALEVSLTRII